MNIAEQTVPENNPSVNVSDSVLKRFLAKVRKTESCWIWTAALEGRSYGNFNLGHRPVSASKASWIIFRGEVPPGMSVLHNCPGGDNPSCVNPDHLWIGTQLENMEDMMKKGRGNKSRGESHYIRRHPEMVIRGSKCVFSKLNEEKVLLIRDKYAKGLYTLTELAKEFGVSAGAIYFVVKRINWKHI